MKKWSDERLETALNELEKRRLIKIRTTEQGDKIKITKKMLKLMKKQIKTFEKIDIEKWLEEQGIYGEKEKLTNLMAILLGITILTTDKEPMEEDTVHDCIVVLAAMTDMKNIINNYYKFISP